MLKMIVTGFPLLAAGAIAAMPAQAATFEFPSEKTTYSTTWDGSGTISSGYRSPALYWAGDSIKQTISGTGLTYIDGFSDTFDIYTSLSVDATVNVLINGISVGSFVLPDCDCSGRRRTVSESLSFAPVTGAGTYEITFVMAGVPGGAGSVAFYDGGSGTLTGGIAAVPELASWAMMLIGFGGIGHAMRRRPKTVAVRFA